MTLPSPGLRTKLFLAMLLTFSILVGAVVTSAHLGFQRGLATYLEEIEVEHAQWLALLLAQQYEHDRGWDRLRDNPRAWSRLVRESLWTASADQDPNMRALLRLGTRVSLIDTAETRIGGRTPDAGATRHPIISDDEIVGWLLLSPSTVITDTLALQFKRQQGQMLFFTSLAALLLAAFASWWLARRLLAPVTALTAGTRSLTAGNFDTRVKLHTADEFQRLADDFNRLAATLQRNERARRDWLADISHELRTPLAVLRGELEAIEDGVRPLDQAALGSLHAETRLLGKLVDDLYQLALSDIGALAYQKESVDVIALLRGLVIAQQPRFAQAGLALSMKLPETPAHVFADESRLTQMFQNLFENSLRYTRSGGRSVLTARCSHERLILTLEDSAPGVSDDMLPRLFERLFRLEESRSRKHGGAGLGLAICRNIAEGHGGRITAQAADLGGLAVTVELPLEAPQ